MDQARTNMPDVHRPCWRDKEGVVHIIRVMQRSHAMCHKWVQPDEISHGIPVFRGLTDDAPNCLVCITMNR